VGVVYLAVAFRICIASVGFGFCGGGGRRVCMEVWRRVGRVGRDIFDRGSGMEVWREWGEGRGEGTKCERAMIKEEKEGSKK